MFPYWSRGRVVFMIGRQTPWTPDSAWEQGKYKKLPVHDEQHPPHRPVHRQLRPLQRGLPARRSRAGHHHRGRDRLHRAHGAGLPGDLAGDGQIREADWDG